MSATSPRDKKDEAVELGNLPIGLRGPRKEFPPLKRTCQSTFPSSLGFRDTSATATPTPSSRPLTSGQNNSGNSLSAGDIAAIVVVAVFVGITAFVSTIIFWNRKVIASWVRRITAPRSDPSEGQQHTEVFQMSPKPYTDAPPAPHAVHPVELDVAQEPVELPATVPRGKVNI